MWGAPLSEKGVEGWARWEQCERERGEEALSRLAVKWPPFFSASTFVNGREARLSFYEKHRLLELTVVRDRGLEPAFVLHGPEQTLWLNGQSDPIHETNEVERLVLTDMTVTDYLRFFLYFLRSDLGAFVLIESWDEVEPGEDGRTATDDANATLTLAAVRNMAAAIQPHRVDGRWLCDGTVTYDGSVFRASFAVQSDGTVEMIGDEKLGELGSISVPEAPSLELAAQTTQDRASLARTGSSEHAIEPPSDREVTEAVVAVLLEDAIREMNSRSLDDNMLLRHFNSETRTDKPQTAIEQLSNLVEGSKPVVIIESDVPFVEDFVAGIVAPHRVASDQVARASAMGGDDLRCEVAVSAITGVYLLSFHTYRGLFDAERVAHELSLSDALVLVGCNRSDDVPEPLRRITDLVLTFPQVDHQRFKRIFERVFHAKPTAVSESVGPDWTRYLVPADFHTPRRLDLSPDDAQRFLRERVQHRLTQVSPDVGPRLSELEGLGEARQIAEDLIEDIQAARADEISWSAVDPGLLLIGAPGTGKTTLARAIARECGIKFVVASAAGWQSAGYLDAHLRAMRADFAEARRYAPAILFIDEIDSIGSRENLEGSNAQYQTEVINALLEELQSISITDAVIVIAATNYLERVDPALRRAGRLDQVVQIRLPSIDGLEKIFAYHLSRFQAEGGPVNEDIDTRALAELAFGLTGADVELFVRGAARRARRQHRPMNQVDLVAEVTRRPRRPDSAPMLGPEDRNAFPCTRPATVSPG